MVATRPCKGSSSQDSTWDPPGPGSDVPEGQVSGFRVGPRSGLTPWPSAEPSVWLAQAQQACSGFSNRLCPALMPFPVRQAWPATELPSSRSKAAFLPSCPVLEDQDSPEDPPGLESSKQQLGLVGVGSRGGALSCRPGFLWWCAASPAARRPQVSPASVSALPHPLTKGTPVGGCGRFTGGA